MSGWRSGCWSMPLRFHRFPEPLVLYVGEAPLRMKGRIEGAGVSFNCAIVDIREMDSEPLLESDILEDNILAILARLSDELAAVRRILVSIAATDPAQRAAALAELVILAGLRNLGAAVIGRLIGCPFLTTSWTTK